MDIYLFPHGEFNFGIILRIKELCRQFFNRFDIALFDTEIRKRRTGLQTLIGLNKTRQSFPMKGRDLSRKNHLNGDGPVSSNADCGNRKCSFRYLRRRRYDRLTKQVIFSSSTNFLDRVDYEVVGSLPYIISRCFINSQL